MIKNNKNRSTFSAAFCVLRLVSLESPSLYTQSNNYPFSSFNDLDKSGKWVGILANCESVIKVIVNYKYIIFQQILK